MRRPFLLKHLQKIFREEYSLTSTKEDIQCFFAEPNTITFVLLSLYQETSIVKTTFKEKGQKAGPGKAGKDSIIFVFDHKLDDSTAFSHNLPRILSPLKADSKNTVEEWISPVKDGHHNVQVSNEALIVSKAFNFKSSSSVLVTVIASIIG